LRKLKLIGIGPGNPDYITIQAIDALNRVDVVFVTNKGDDAADFVQVRKEICERYMRTKPYRIIEMNDPKRDRNASAYRSSVAAWHEQRATMYEEVIRDALAEDECGAFLVWGDPSLYDSTLRIVDRLAQRGTVEFEFEIIPGITSIQALAARHKVSLNQIGEPIHITTGRRLKEDTFSGGANVVVLLDGECAFKALADEDMDIYWGAYLGTPNEILRSGKLSEVKEEIEAVRTRARKRNGWIMDIYLLRKGGARDAEPVDAE